MPVRQLPLSPKQAGQAAQRFQAANVIAVGLFFLGNDHGGTEQAVADAVTLTAPRYSVIDNVGIHGAVFPDLSDLNPAVLNQHINGPLDGSAATLH